MDAVHPLSPGEDRGGPTEGEPDAVKVARPVVRPAKAGVFSGSQSHRGKSQTPRSLDGRQEGNRMS